MTVIASADKCVRFLIPVLFVVCSFHVSDLRGGIITWGAATTITGDSDVSTNGALIGGGNFSDGDTLTINGATFTAIAYGTVFFSSGNFEFTLSVTGGADGDFGSGSSPFSSLSTDYRDLLDSAMYTHSPSSTPADITMEISKLTIGHQYEFQWWVNDSRNTGDFDRTTTALAGNSVTLQHNVGNAEGGVGQFAIGTFTADATTQQIVFQGAGTGLNGGSTQVNAFQIRTVAVPEPTSLTLVGIAAVAGVALGWRKRRQRTRNLPHSRLT